MNQYKLGDRVESHGFICKIVKVLNDDTYMILVIGGTFPIQVKGVNLRPFTGEAADEN